MTLSRSFRLAEYKILLNVATEMCTQAAKKINRHNCYWSDNGCGYHCLDELAKMPGRIGLDGVSNIVKLPHVGPEE